MSDGVSESCASSLAKGFESTAPAWLAQAQPCASLPIRVNPAHPWFKIHLPPIGLPKRSPKLLRLFVKISVLRGSKKNDFAVNDFAKMECRETTAQRRELLPLLTLTFTHPCHAEAA